MPKETLVPFIGVQHRLYSDRSYETVMERLFARVGKEPLALSAMLVPDPSLANNKKENKRLGDFRLISNTEVLREESAGRQSYRVARVEIANPVVVSQMFSEATLSALFAPITFLFIEHRSEEGCSLNYVVPSTLAVIGDSPVLAKVAKELDIKVRELVTSLASNA